MSVPLDVIERIVELKRLIANNKVKIENISELIKIQQSEIDELYTEIDVFEEELQILEDSVELPDKSNIYNWLPVVKHQAPEGKAIGVQVLYYKDEPFMIQFYATADEEWYAKQPTDEIPLKYKGFYNLDGSKLTNTTINYKLPEIEGLSDFAPDLDPGIGIQQHSSRSTIMYPKQAATVRISFNDIGNIYTIFWRSSTESRMEEYHNSEDIKVMYVGFKDLPRYHTEVIKKSELTF